MEKDKKTTKSLKDIGMINAEHPGNENSFSEEEMEKYKEYRQKALELSLAKTRQAGLRQISSELKKGRKVEDMVQEVKDKKSPYSKSVRDTLVFFKPEAIQHYCDLIDELDKMGGV